MYTFFYLYIYYYFFNNLCPILIYYVIFKINIPQRNIIVNFGTSAYKNSPLFFYRNQTVKSHTRVLNFNADVEVIRISNLIYFNKYLQNYLKFHSVLKKKMFQFYHVDNSYNYYIYLNVKNV